MNNIDHVDLMITIHEMKKRIEKLETRVPEQHIDPHWEFNHIEDLPRKGSRIDSKAL
jgi:hypothetical protein